MKCKNQKGSILYYTVLTLGILYSGAVAISIVLVGQIGTVAEMSNSVGAFYAADAGAEEILSRWEYIHDDEEQDESQLNWGTWMYVDETVGSGNGIDERNQMYRYQRADREVNGEDSLVIVIPGTYRGTRRAIQISRPKYNE